MMDSSRIFINGLPPTITAQDFKVHFSKLSPITDSKLICRRRIGYIGYRSHDEAVKAVKYFNKSYIRMSKISVELARPVDELKSAKVRESPHIEAKYESRRDKQEQNYRGVGDSNPKLKEFLQVMQPPSKSKIWANEDNLDPVREILATATEAAPISIEEGHRNDEFEHISKKRKKLPNPVPQPVDVAHVLPENEHPVNGQEERVEPQVNPTTDADWLRSRTSRLLGLIDDDDDDKLMIGTASKEGDPGSSDNLDAIVKQSSVAERSHASSQTDDEPVEVPSAAERTSDPTAEGVVKTGRLFVRNLLYTVSESDLREHFSHHGSTTEVHVALDPRTGAGKGIAYIQYEDSGNAELAMSELDGKPFQGRLLHILPASAKREYVLDEYAISKLPIKTQKQLRRKAEAASTTFKWNSMYMNPDAVMSSVANRLGLSKSEILDPTSSGTAVKQAHAETNVIQEAKSYFMAHGINLEAFKKHELDERAILIKNFPHGTSSQELKKLFEAYGSVSKVLMPPSGTIAIVELEQAPQARSAFKALSYRKFKDSILFLEKAPKGVLETSGNLPKELPNEIERLPNDGKLSTTDLLIDKNEEPAMNTSTLFVRNLNFKTTTERLHEVFKPLVGFMSARVKTKPDPKKSGGMLSMGFGFLEFRSKTDAQAALTTMDGYNLDGHSLLIKASHRAVDAAEERRKEDYAKKISERRTKIIIKNLPFEASKKDVRALFAPYGQLRSVRVPKKFDNSTRGFAFADFVTTREAENAISALRDTHLLGRRLVLDFSAGDSLDPEEEIEKMRQKVGNQTNKVAQQVLSVNGRKRKKFVVEVGGEDIRD